MKLHQYIERELFSTCQHFHSEEDNLYIAFFPQLDRAYIEHYGKTNWVEASGVNDAVNQAIETEELKQIHQNQSIY